MIANGAVIAKPTNGSAAKPGIGRDRLRATDAEKSVLCSMLIDDRCIPDVLSVAGATDFQDFANAAIFREIERRHRSGEPLDVVLILEALRTSAAPGVDYRLLLAEISQAEVTAAHAKHYAGIVRDASRRNRLLDLADEITLRARSGESIDAAIVDAHCALETELNGDRGDDFEEFTAGELFEQYPDEAPPVIDGICRQGEIMNIIAAAKAGKTWFTMALVTSLVANTPWLGRFEVAPGKVLLIDNELARGTLSRRLRAVADAQGIPQSFIKRDLIVWPLRGNLKSLEQLGPKLEKFQPGELKAVVFDAFYRFIPKGVSENDNAAITQIYNLLNQYASKLDAALILIHHSSKGTQGEKSVTDVGSGAGSQSRAADAHLVIRPHQQEGCAVMDAAVRSFPPIDPVVIRWTWPLWRIEEHLDPSQLAGRLGKGQQARVEEDSADKQRILDKLTWAAAPLSTKGIREATGYGKEKAQRLIFSLLADGSISKGEGVIGRQKCTVYALKESSGTAGTQAVQTPSVPPAMADPRGEGGVPNKDRHTPSTPTAGTREADRKPRKHLEFEAFAEGS